MRISRSSLLPILLLVASVSAFESFEGSIDGDETHRSPKLLLNPFGILGNDKCEYKGDEGRCYGEVECLALAGNYGPFCDGLKGLCCVFKRTCHQRTSREVAYFQNTEYPMEHQDPNTCTFKVVRRGNEYCGLRMVAQVPSDQQAISRHCASTNLYIVGAGTAHKPFPLCKNGRALPIDYTIDYSHLKDVSLSVNSSTRTSAAWKIKIEQIKCADFDGLSDNTGVSSSSGTSGSGSSGPSTAVFPPPMPEISKPATSAPSQPSPPAPPPTTTTSRPENSLTPNRAKCGQKGGLRFSRNDYENYFGINRKKFVSPRPELTQPGPVNRHGVETDNPFLDDLEYDGPDNADSLFHYWRGPESLLSNRVTYGQDARKHEYRWQIAMFVRRRYHCGGSIIGDRFILTAAHCVVSYKRDPSKLTLSLGDYDVSTKSDAPYLAYKVETVRIHPDYSRSTLQNDLAVLKVTKRIEYSERVGPVCLPTSDIPTDGKLATITGWGRDENKKLKSKLQELTSTVVTNTKCSDAWRKKRAPAGFIVGTMMCMDSTDGDSCNGDSGGPSVMEIGGSYVQVGIVSFGSGSCTDPNLPGVYTRVSKYRDWIRQQMY